MCFHSIQVLLSLPCVTSFLPSFPPFLFFFSFVECLLKQGINKEESSSIEVEDEGLSIIDQVELYHITEKIGNDLRRLNFYSEKFMF